MVRDSPTLGQLSAPGPLRLGFGVLGVKHGVRARVKCVLSLPPPHTFSPCRDLGEGTRELAGVAHSVDKDLWTLSTPSYSPWAQMMVHTVNAGHTPPAPRPTVRMPTQPMTHVRR